MDYKINNNGGSATVVFSGDITFSENVSFRQLLKDIAEQQVESCVFDLSSVDMVDSAGLGMFLIAREQAETAGWKLSVSGAQGHVASMLKLTKLSDLLDG
ncbi:MULTISPECIES: STAS domain-containing protein [Kordiimonas]|uniref:STAS domain-containing protein n=1 Tax=Kordiimonas TaxID=288021 RepID=UPI001FF0E591|nr:MULTISPECIES: STAS domain-containing protein [Kordiimonas]MCK0069698.1 STAS domain-containing protein [Kordiimonas laminariae]UTW57163.1 STAS domain-containing protein [Kordiimonas sp. SCSIO 12603]